MRRSACGAFILSLALAAAALAQQSAPQPTQDDALAAAARQAREQKKQQAKSTRVWDNDNIPKTPGTLSVVGDSAALDTASSADSQAASANGDDKSADAKAPENPQEKKKALEADMADAKEALQNLQNDLDIMQHKLALDQQTYYGKPEYSSDKAGAAAIADEQSQVDAKQVEMGNVQQKLAALQAQMDALSEPKPSDK
jgi:hypothetical protein